MDISLDARKEDDVINFVKEVETNVGPIEVAIYNIGGNIKFGITEQHLRSTIKHGKWLHLELF